MNWYTGRTKAITLYERSGREPLHCAHYDVLHSSLQGTWTSPRSDAFQDDEKLSGLYAKLHVVRTLDHETLYNISDVRDYTNAMWQLPMRTEFLRGSWHFCEHVYSDVSVHLGVLSVGNVTTNPLTLVSLDSKRDYTFHSNASGLNYTVAGSPLGEVDSYSVSQLFDLHLGYNPGLSHHPGPTYSSSEAELLSCSRTDGERIGPSFGSSVSDLIQSLSINLRSADIEALTNNLASTLTARIRSNISGGNANVTMLPGQAFVNEAYIEVQWPWMILPITEIVLAAAALAITIVLTRQQALLKGSTVSLLMQRIDGWSLDETRVRRFDTSEQLRDRAKKMIVRLDEGQDGEMMFKG